MKVVKPLELSPLYKVFRYQQRNVLSMGVVLAFSLSQRNERVLEQDFWAKAMEALGGEPLDEGMPKIYPEVLLWGSFHAPGGQACGASSVRLKFGKEVDKTLLVFGDRYWNVFGKTKPTQMLTMSVSYRQAYGGPEYAPNPLGKGYAAIVDAETGDKIYPLPNIENPKSAIVFKMDGPEPVGFWALGAGWPQRASRMGNYGSSYVHENFPGFASDIDMSFFNMAPPDQWLKGEIGLEEAFELYHLHPAKPLFRGQLPPWRARAFVTLKPLEPHPDDPFDLLGLKEIHLKPETVILFPDLDMGAVIHRGTMVVRENDLSDLSHLLLAYEGLGEVPRSEAYYSECLRKRLDPATASDYDFDTREIIPAGMPCVFQNMLEPEGEPDQLCANVQKRIDALEKKLEADAQAQALRLGTPVLPVVPPLANPLPLPKKLSELNGPLLANLQKSLEAQMERASLGMRCQLEAKIAVLEQQGNNPVGLNLARQALKDFLEQAQPYPRPSGEKNLKQAHLAKFQHDKRCVHLITLGVAPEFLPKFDTDLEALALETQAADIAFMQAYQLSAHHGEGGRAPRWREHAEIKAELLRRYQLGESCANMDLADLDLGGEDLEGIDLRNCFMENVRLEGANLSKALLQGAILCGARLKGCTLNNADLQNSNLGKVEGSQTKLCGADLRGAVLEGSIFKSADFSGANMEGLAFHSCTEFMDTKFNHTRLTKMLARQGVFEACCFDGAIGDQGMWVQCRGRNCSFVEAQWPGFTFLDCQLPNSRFDKAQMNKASFVGECHLEGSSFREAVLNDGGLRGCSLVEADFSGAKVERSDLCGALLRKSIWVGANLREALFMKSDLSHSDLSEVQAMKASFMDAKLVGVNFSRANLYACEFMGSTMGQNLYKGALLDLTLLEHWRHP